MGNTNDEGRGMKDLIYGVPTGYGLTREEQILRELTDGTKLLRERLPYPSSQTHLLPAPASSTNIVNVLPSEAPDISPHLRGIAREQEDTRRSIEGLTEQGTEGLRLQRDANEERMYQTTLAETAGWQRGRLVRQGRRAVSLLESLDESGRMAFLQRLAVLGGLSNIRNAIAATGIQISEGLDEVSARVLGLQEQGRVNIAELQQHTSLLNGIVDLETMGLQESRRHTVALQGIEGGIYDLVGLAGESVDVLNQHTEQLDDLGAKIDAGNVIARSSSQYLASMASNMDLFVLQSWKARQALERILHTIERPVHTKAFEQWSIGERCRAAGDTAQAQRMFQASQLEDPSEARNYYSLGMISLELGATSSAQHFFALGFEYAQRQPKMACLLLLSMSRNALAHNNFGLAKKYLEMSHGMDHSNLDVWYELAFVETKLGNTNNALYFLNNLFKVARLTAPGYIHRVLHEPAFQSVYNRITQ